MRAFVDPIGLHSPAMKRVAAALKRHAPPGISIVQRAEDADLVVFHMINAAQITEAARCHAQGQRYAVVQYCLRTAGGELDDWISCWKHAALVWSYYNLGEKVGRIDVTQAGDEKPRYVERIPFMYAPLGLDRAFVEPPVVKPPRRSMIITTGHVAGPSAEAIEEVWMAAEIAGVEIFHVGAGKVEGMERPGRWRFRVDISDEELAMLYRSSAWVAAMRHIEGFELPAAEGLACGARPIMFDQPATKHWYEDHAVYLPDIEGRPLVERLVYLFQQGPRSVSDKEREAVIERFNWAPIANVFWARVNG